jgi:dipeptidyl aminopeptidase/acylaminoacyl peptidase
LLLVHGAADKVVPVLQSRALAGTLKTAGINSFRYVELPQADEALSLERDRTQVFQELDRFLQRYLH